MSSNKPKATRSLTSNTAANRQPPSVLTPPVHPNSHKSEKDRVVPAPVHPRSYISASDSPLDTTIPYSPSPSPPPAPSPLPSTKSQPPQPLDPVPLVPENPFTDEDGDPIFVAFAMEQFQSTIDVKVNRDGKCLLALEGGMYILFDAESNKILKWFVDMERLSWVSEDQGLIIFAHSGSRVHSVYDIMFCQDNDDRGFLGTFKLGEHSVIEDANSGFVLTCDRRDPAALLYQCYQLNPDKTRLAIESNLRFQDRVLNVKLAKNGAGMIAIIASEGHTVPTTCQVFDMTESKAPKSLTIPSEYTQWMRLIMPSVLLTYSFSTQVANLHRINYDAGSMEVLADLGSGFTPLVVRDIVISMRRFDGTYARYILDENGALDKNVTTSVSVDSGSFFSDNMVSIKRDSLNNSGDNHVVFGSVSITQVAEQPVCNTTIEQSYWSTSMVYRTLSEVEIITSSMTESSTKT